MQVILRVAVGRAAGREIKIISPVFVIGRGEGCHLRPRSDTVSRKHCALLLREDGLYVRDLQSRNGVLVNGQRIEADCPLRNTDRLKVGDLEFEILIDQSATAPVPSNAAAVEGGSREQRAPAVDDKVTTWLDEADGIETSRRLAEPDTRQFKLDETDRITLGTATETDEADKKGDKSDSTGSTEDLTAKKEPGKLPKPPRYSAKDSRDAAADMLSKFFNRR